MISLKFQVPLFLFTCGIINFVFCVPGDGNQSIDIVLNKPITWQDRETYSEFIYINKTSTIKFNVIKNNNNISFIIFQVHSHLYNIIIYNNTFVDGSYITGKNLGLYSSVVPKIDKFYVMNPNDFDLKLLVTVLAYTNEDPIPGGCNMEFPIPVSPYLRTIYKKDYIFVDAAAPRYYSDQSCMLISDVSVEFYMMYLPERNFDADTYYDGLKKMMTMEKIRENGDRVPKTLWAMRRMLSAYPGKGTIYVAVATNTRNPKYYSIYVPIHNYACLPSEDEGCEMLDGIFSKFMCATLLFIGIFMTYFGHKFFKTEMFLFGMLSGVIITYIIISIMTDLDRSVLIIASIMSGLFFGAIWLTFWWFYGIPVIAVYLPALNLGFLLSAIIYNKFPGDVILLQQNFNFWTLFILIMLLTSMMLVSVAYVSNILCCAVLGGYAVIYPIDFYLGSNLKYIIINTVRRATVPKFNMAVLNLPFEWRDALVAVIWIGLAVSGFLFQNFQNHGRPPFPPPPRSVRPGTPDRPRYGAVPGSSRIITPSASSMIPERNAPLPNYYNEKTPLLA